MAIEKLIENPYQIPADYCVIIEQATVLDGILVTVGAWQSRPRFLSGATPLRTFTFTFPLPVIPLGTIETWAIANEPLLLGGIKVP